jgi:hypothetical protein
MLLNTLINNAFLPRLRSWSWPSVRLKPITCPMAVMNVVAIETAGVCYSRYTPSYMFGVITHQIIQ